MQKARLIHLFRAFVVLITIVLVIYIIGLMELAKHYEESGGISFGSGAEFVCYCNDYQRTGDLRIDSYRAIFLVMHGILMLTSLIISTYWIEILVLGLIILFSSIYLLSRHKHRFRLSKTNPPPPSKSK